MQVNRREFFGLLTAAGAALLPSGAPARTAESRTEAAPAATELGRSNPWLELSAANLAWNLQQIEQRVGGKPAGAGKPVMAVVKANGYGHGLVGVARALAAAGAKHFLVGKLDEARELRHAGIRGTILNFGPFSDAEAEEIIRLGVSQNVYTDQVEVLARAAARREWPARVHIKVDTGLGRVGVPYGGALEFIERVAEMRGIQIEGVFTTFTEDADFDPVQLARFKEVCTRAASRGLKLGLRHAASSDAICNFPAAYEQLDMVRPGILLYGLYPSERAEQERTLDLKPVLALKTRVAYVKTLAPGESVSYHRVFTATEPTRVATLPVGYSDGVPRALAPQAPEQAGKGSVLVGGRRCPILAISANATIVRLPAQAGSGDAPTAVGDEAVLIGKQGSEEITASEVARLAGTSVYALVMGMNPLLPQVYVP